ncbi:MAG TPA: RnfABCDGE type electron transport complex subunit D [Planctomycetota bacterium]|nr:RnfABCDGE type electron transport complex subunit D [Planctomycetota bacterium]
MSEKEQDAPAKGNSGKASRKTRLFLKQPMMTRMLIALAPVLVAGVYFFGWRVLGVLVVTLVAGVATEYLMERPRGKGVSAACFVTCALYALSLPPTMPFWMVVVGIVVGLLFGKEVYGGFGRNWCNPAIVGRAFVYVAFPVHMTGSFVPAFRGFPGGFAHWSFESLGELPTWLSGKVAALADAVPMATPGIAARDYGLETDWTSLFWGSIGGTFETDAGTRVLAAGSVGEVCAPLIILAGVYLIVTRTADWRLMLSMLIGALGVNAILLAAGADRTLTMPQVLFGGSLLYGAVYMVTEPISAPKRKSAKWIYGVLVGTLLVLIRWKGQFAGSLSFSLLLGNMLAPSIDMGVQAWKNRGKTDPAKETTT